MHLRFSLPFALLALVMNSSAATSLSQSSTFNAQAVDDLLKTQVQRASRVGLSVAVVRDGEIVLARGYGKCSLTGLKPVDTDTLFAIGSVTKQFTCAAVLLLAEDGKLSVRDPVAKYFPNLTRAKDITLLDLMNHVSGYPDYYPLDFVDRRMQQAIGDDELLRQYAGGKLDFEPGSKYSYSNTGYILLGRVVEKVSGETFGAFLARRLLKPLGLDHTVYEPDPADPRLAKGYTTFALGSAEPVGPEAKGWIGAAGGIYSTPSDLAKWDLALIGGKVLKPESLALMTSPRKLSDGKTSDYGCGLSLKTQSSRAIWTHNGAVSGFNASNAMIPSTRSAVIIMANLDGGLGTLPAQILSLLLAQEPAALPVVSGASAVDTAKSLFASLQKGKVDRARFSEDFNLYLTDEKISGAAGRLKRYGTPTKTEIVSSHERGGMEVTVTRLTFKSGSLRTLMYRMPDGKVQQFFVSKD